MWKRNVQGLPQHVRRILSRHRPLSAALPPMPPAIRRKSVMELLRCVRRMLTIARSIPTAAMASVKPARMPPHAHRTVPLLSAATAYSIPASSAMTGIRQAATDVQQRVRRRKMVSALSLALPAGSATNAAAGSTADGASGAKKRKVVHVETSKHPARPATTVVAISSAVSMTRKIGLARRRIHRQRASVMMGWIMVTLRTRSQIRPTPIATNARTVHGRIRPTWPIATTTDLRKAKRMCRAAMRALRSSIHFSNPLSPG